MLSFEHKRQILLSFPELQETVMANQRYNYELRFVDSGKRVIAREFTHTGNGYVLGTLTSPYPVDERGWIKVKEFTESDFISVIRLAINQVRRDRLLKEMQAVLQSTGLDPYTMWRELEIEHVPPGSEDGLVNVKNVLQGVLGDTNGLYMYTTFHGEILYIGKGKPLWNRLWSHYLESFQSVSGDTKNQRWHRFFSSHQGRLLVRWIELEDEALRQIVEQILTVQFRPSFLDFR